MIYLSGAVREEVEALLIAGGVGLMMTPVSGYRIQRALAYPCWAADNGCFANPEAFRLERYLAWLQRLAPARDRCLFATAPDVWGDWPATWERSRPVLSQLRELGYPAALVAQDGIERAAVEWDAFDALFVGGTDDWRFSEPMVELVQEARARGKWTHLGRVNSRRRLRLAAVCGYQSADGTQIAFAPARRAEQVVRWIAELRVQPRLELACTP